LTSTPFVTKRGCQFVIAAWICSSGIGLSFVR
jgi:hypothetical protein